MSHGQLKHASCQIHMQGSIFSLTQFVLKTSRFFLKFFMFLQIAVKPFVHLLSFLAYLISVRAFSIRCFTAQIFSHLQQVNLHRDYPFLNLVVDTVKEVA